MSAVRSRPMGPNFSNAAREVFGGVYAQDRAARADHQLTREKQRQAQPTYTI